MRVRSLFYLIVLSAWVIVQRWWWSNLPLERDSSTYGVIARGLLQGRSLYADLWDHKPPGIHLLYTVAAAAFGSTEWGVYLLGIICAVLTLWLVIAATATFRPGTSACWWAGLFFALIQGDLVLEAYQPNTEVGINLFNCLALAALGLWLQQRSVVLAICIAITTVAASLFKQVAIVPVVCALTVLILERRSGALRLLVLMGLATCAAWAAFLQNMPGAFDAVVTYNRFYAGNLSENLVSAFAPGHLVPRAGLILTPLVILALWGMRRSFVLLAWFAGTFIAVALPGQFYNHYYQLYFPILAIGAALSISSFSTRLIPGATALVIFVYQLSFMVNFYGETFSIARHGLTFVDSKHTGLKLRDLGRTVAQVGNDSGISFYSGSIPPSGVVYTAPLESGPLAHELQERLISDLKRTQPDLIIAPANDTFLAGFTEFTELLKTYQQCHFEGARLGAAIVFARASTTCPSLN